MTTYVKPGSPHDQGLMDNNFHRRSYEDEMDGSLRRRVNCLTGLVVVVCIIAAASLALSVMLLMQDQGDVTVSEEVKLRLSSLEDMMHPDNKDHQQHMSVQQSSDSNRGKEHTKQDHSHGIHNDIQDNSEEDTEDYHEHQDENEIQMNSEEDISVEKHDDKEAIYNSSQGSTREDYVDPLSNTDEKHIYNEDIDNRPSTISDVGDLNQDTPKYPGITFEKKPAPVLPPFPGPYDDIDPDDEDYNQEGSGLGSEPCTNYSKPVCPMGYRVCSTNEKCPKPVCCK